MSKRWIKAGSTDQTIDIFVQDSSSTVGAGLTGLAYNTASLTCYYRKGATGTPTALTLATQTVGGAHSDGGFVAVDGTNMPGVYRLDLSDTIVASAGMVTIYLRGATNMVPVVLELEAVSVDIYDTVRMGLTALPNANADAAGGLPISDAGGLDLDAQLVTKINDILTDTGTTLDGKLDTIDDFLDTEVAAIKAKTDNLPADPADASDVASSFTTVNTKLDTIDDFLDTEIAAIKAKTDNLPASPAAVGSAMTLDMTQAVPTSNTAQTVGDCLNAARAQGFGKWVLSGTTLTLYANDGTTAVKTFTLDSATSPTSRTP